MSDADMHQELLRLRKQVEALSAARRQHKAAPETEEDDAESASEQWDAEHTFKEQIDDLMKLLQEEIRDMPAMPTLAVFMLGVLVGRYLR